MANQLDLAVLRRSWEIKGPRRAKREVVDSVSIDFVIDGSPLSARLGGDADGMFMHRQHRFFRDGAYNRDLRPVFFDITSTAKRLNLYSTCYCGDPWCGAVACDVWRSGQNVLWSGFAYEDGYTTGRYPVPGLGAFEFDAAQYIDTIERAVRGEA